MAHFLCHLGCSHFGALLLDFHFTENKRGLFLLEGGFLTVKQPYNTTIYNTALYLRLSRDDELQGESGSIQTQELICKGWFLPPNTYDCGSFVVNGTAVVGKEKKSPYNRWKSTQKGANFYEISI